MGQDLTKHTKVAGSNENLYQSKLRSLNSSASSKCKYSLCGVLCSSQPQL